MIERVLIADDTLEFLKKRQLLGQFYKAKKFIISGDYKRSDFKLRKPKKENIYYFRINKQFRALCKLDKGVLKIFDIDNHQN